MARAYYTILVILVSLTNNRRIIIAFFFNFTVHWTDTQSRVTWKETVLVWEFLRKNANTHGKCYLPPENVYSSV